MTHRNHLGGRNHFRPIIICQYQESMIVYRNKYPDQARKPSSIQKEQLELLILISRLVSQNADETLCRALLSILKNRRIWKNLEVNEMRDILLIIPKHVYFIVAPMYFCCASFTSSFQISHRSPLHKSQFFMAVPDGILREEFSSPVGSKALAHE